MSSNASDQRRNKPDIKNRMLVAEGLRLDGKSQMAVERFREIEMDEAAANSLPPKQRRWLLAHHATAELECFIPYSDLESHLERAQTLLHRALGLEGKDPLDDGHIRYPWAWARLGEVFRHKGSLPPVDFFWDETASVFRLWTRDSGADYEKGIKCFRTALEQRPDYPWASAHLGSLIINARRHHVPGGFEFKMGMTQKAVDHFTGALKMQSYRNAWALFGQACSLFVAFMDNLVNGLSRNPPVLPGDNEMRALHIIYSMSIALIDDPPSFMRNPLHPGAMLVDEALTMAHDLLDYLPLLVKEHKNTKSAPQVAACVRDLASLVKTILAAGRNFARPDRILPEAASYRFHYAEFYVDYLLSSLDDASRPARATPEPLPDLDLRPLLDGFPWPIIAKERSGHTGHTALLRLFDVMMILLRHGAIDQLRSQPPNENLVKTLDDFNSKLPVLKTGLTARTAIDKVANLARDNDWLLAPLWVLNSERGTMLGEFLDVRRMEKA